MSQDVVDTRRARGYPDLLNLGAQPHWTVFVSDFVLPAANIRHLKRELKSAATRPLFIRLNDRRDGVAEQLASAGVDFENDYVSLQGIISRQENLAPLHQLFDTLRHRDLARLEVPFRECGFQPSFASHLLDVVMQGDYAEQDRISDRFFFLLRKRKPYVVTVETPGSRLQVRDTVQWFDFAGRLRQGEGRFLPGGEVAYNGERVNGAIVVDGAILPVAQYPSAAQEARRLQRISRLIAKDPVTFIIRAGRVVEVQGRRAADGFSKLFGRDERYREVTEVGISFNRACKTFVHHWAAVSNETRPGVHLGIGGGGTSRNSGALVHIDCIVANCQVFVNGHPFLRASS
jgi:hypothetical protein